MAVSLSELQATTPNAIASPEPTAKSFLLIIRFISVRDQLWSYAEIDADRTSRRQRCELDSLEISGLEGEFRIDVRHFRPGVQISPGDRNVHRTCVEHVGPPLRQIEPHAYLSQLHIAVVEDVRFVDGENVLQILLRRHVGRVLLTGDVIDTLDDNTGIVPVDLPAFQGLRKHAGVVAEIIGDAEDLAAALDVEQGAERHPLVIDLVVPASGPPRLDVAKDFARADLSDAIVKQQLTRRAIPQERVPEDRAIRLPGSRFDIRVPRAPKDESLNAQCELFYEAIVA